MRDSLFLRARATLVKYFVTEAKKHGCKAVKSRVNTMNAIAQAFQESLGFEKGKTCEYFLYFEEHMTDQSIKTR